MQQASTPRQLNLGCGLRRRDACLNVDGVEKVRPDLLRDLDSYAYPLPESHFRTVFAYDVIEHLRSIPDFMREVHRLAAPGGTIEITTWHFSCANSYTDPTNLHHLGHFSFDHFADGSDLNFYAEVRFENVERQLVFQHNLANRIVARLANRHPGAYEQRFAWMFPTWFMIFRLRAVK